MPASVDILGLSCRQAHPCSSPDHFTRTITALYFLPRQGSHTQRATPPKQQPTPCLHVDFIHGIKHRLTFTTLYSLRIR